MKRQYTSIFAGVQHQRIRTFEDCHRWPTLGLFCNDVPVGDGQLRIINSARKYLQTDSVGLLKEFRRKGHGLPLYFALIRTAKKVGAKRLYSSHSLNKYSRKMWGEKLPKFFKVHRICGCKHCFHGARFYIQFDK